jgi:DNA-binding winged helix-turn-helix (wHTH) protein
MTRERIVVRIMLPPCRRKFVGGSPTMSRRASASLSVRIRFGFGYRLTAVESVRHSETPPMRLSFGDCVFDGHTRELVRAGVAVHVPPKTFQLLEILLEQRPGAVSKTSLMEALWPGVFVAEGNLARLVAELREMIGDDAQAPRFVRTVPRFGYAFHGEAVEQGPERKSRRAPTLFRISWGQRDIALAEGENVLGRDASADVSVDDASVSRHHARILIDGASARLEDLGSKNGTFVGNRRLNVSVPLRDGDRIRLGLVVLVFRRLESGVSTATASSI